MNTNTVQQLQSHPDRILTLDIGRGLAVIVMVMVHTLWMYGSQETQSQSVVGGILHLLGKGTAAFLVLMGFSMALSSRQSSLLILQRGVLLLLAGYGLNAIKFIVPIALFGTMPTSFTEAYGWQAPLSTAHYTYLLLTGDILQMAGTSLLLIALVRRWLNNSYSLFFLIFIVTCLSTEIRGWQPGVNGLDYVADLLWGADYNVYFPVFPWMACILTGLFFGNLFVRWRRDEARTFRVMALSGIVLVTIGLLTIYWDAEYHFNDFFHLGPGGVFYLLGLNGIAIWIIYRVMQAFSFGYISQFLIWCSARVTSLYAIQWTLVCWGMGIIGFQTLSPLQLTLMLPVMLAITFITQHLLELMVLSLRSLMRKNTAQTSIESI